MNIKKLKLWTISLFVFTFLPAISEAYFTTSQEAVQLNETSALYSVTYKFGFSDREVYMPIIPLRNSVVPEQGLYAGYILVNNYGEEIKIGQMNGIILTEDNVEIKNNQYYVPAGKSASFTLIALLTFSKNENIEDEASLLVSQLPFTMIDDGNAIPNHLNPSELKYYRTPALNF